jgi:rubrerythrin
MRQSISTILYLVKSPILSIIMAVSEWTIEQALIVGRTMEEGAIKLYTETAEKVKNPGSKQLLLELAEEEKKHRAYFQRALENPEMTVNLGGAQRKIADFKITDMLRETTLSPEATYQDILIFAGKSEKMASDFYSNLAEQFKGHQIGVMLAEFAQQELAHKQRLEKEYDDVVLAEM